MRARRALLALGGDAGLVGLVGLQEPGDQVGVQLITQLAE